MLGCSNVLGGSGIAYVRLSQYEAMVTLEAKATVYTLESGIIFHSIFIGVTMGSTSGASLVRSLGIALMFHQGNEVRSQPDLRDIVSVVSKHQLACVSSLVNILSLGRLDTPNRLSLFCEGTTVQSTKSIIDCFTALRGTRPRKSPPAASSCCCTVRLCTCCSPRHGQDQANPTPMLVTAHGLTNCSYPSASSSCLVLR
jgi:hypothetical protein